MKKKNWILNKITIYTRWSAFISFIEGTYYIYVVLYPIFDFYALVLKYCHEEYGYLICGGDLSVIQTRNQNSNRGPTVSQIPLIFYKKINLRVRFLLYLQNWLRSNFHTLNLLTSTQGFINLKQITKFHILTCSIHNLFTF